MLARLLGRAAVLLIAFAPFFVSLPARGADIEVSTNTTSAEINLTTTSPDNIIVDPSVTVSATGVPPGLVFNSGNNITLGSFSELSGTDVTLTAANLFTANDGVTINANQFALNAAAATFNGDSSVFGSVAANFNAPIVISAGSQLMVRGKPIFSDTIDGPGSLSVTASPGQNMEFLGNIGSSNPLSAITLFASGGGNILFLGTNPQVTTVGALTFDGSVMAGSNLALSASSITQGGGTAISVPSLSVNGCATLAGGANSIPVLQSYTGSSGCAGSIATSTALAIGATSGGTSLALSAGGAITQTDAIGGLSLAITGCATTLTNASNAFTALSYSGGGSGCNVSASTTAGLDFLGVTGAGNLNLTAASFSGSGALTAVGAATLNSASAGTITSSNVNIGGGLSLFGDATLTGTGSFTAGDISVASASAVNLPASATVGGLSGAGTISIAGGTAHITGDGSTFTGGLGGAGTFELTTGTQNLASTVTVPFQIDAAATVAISGTAAIGTLTGSGALAVNAGTLTLGAGGGSGDQRTGGTTTIVGTLAAGGANVFSAANGYAMNAGTLSLGNANQTLGALTGNGTVALGSGTLTLGGASTFSGTISGTGGITTGAGTVALTLAGSNYTGATTVNGGTLKLASVNAFASSGVMLNGTSALLDFTGNGTYNGTIAGSGGIAVDGGGTLTLGGVNTYTGATALNAGTLVVSSGGSIASTGALLFNGGTLINNGAPILNFGSISGTGTVQNGGTMLTTGGDNSSTGFTGTISGSGGLDKTGSGTLTLTGANTYSGATTIDGGTLAVTGNAVIPIGGAVSVTNGGTFALPASGDVTIGSLAGGGAVALGTGTLTAGGDGTSTTFAGSIGGAGALTKTGGGTLTLTGINGYTGGTTIAQGGLTGTAAAFGVGPIANFGTLTFAQDTDGTFAPGITGAGTLLKSGAGTLILDGIDSAGSTTVSAGTLEIGDVSTPGAQLTSAVNVNAGGTLRGHGTIVGNVMNVGTLQPGGSVGTLTVTGNYTQGPGGTFVTEIAPGGNDTLKVSGTATLGGTLNLQIDAGAPEKQSFTLVQAGDLTGSFANVTSNASALFLKTNLTQTAQALQLTLFLNATNFCSGFARTANQCAVGGILDRSFATATGDLGNTVFPALLALTTPAQVQSALDAMGGAVYAALPSVALDATRQSMDVIRARMNDDGRGGWISGMTAPLGIAGTTQAPSVTATTNGTLIGYDRDFGSHWLLGFAAGRTHTDMSVANAGNDSATIDATRLAGYARYQAGSFDLDGTIEFANDTIGANRSIMFGTITRLATAATAADENAASLFATFGPKEAVALRAGVSYRGFHDDGFAETGANALDLVANGHYVEEVEPSIGVVHRSSTRGSNGRGVLLTFDGDIAADISNLARGDDMQLAGAEGAGTFTTTAVPADGAAFDAHAGAEDFITAETSIFADLSGRVDASSTSATADVGVRMRF